MAVVSSVAGVCAVTTTAKTAQAENIDWCAAATPDKSVTWGAGVSGLHVSGNATDHQNCHAFIVDFHVSPATAQPIANYTNNLSFSEYDPHFPHVWTGEVLNLTQAECSTWEERALVYHKLQGQTQYSLLTGGTSRGVWRNGGFLGDFCVLESLPGTMPPVRMTAPTIGDGTYRVVFSATKAGVLQPPTVVFADHLPQPPG
jgi:hypothetical protein